MISVFAIAYGRHCEDKADLGKSRMNAFYGSTKIVGTLIDSQFFLLEESLGALPAVIHDLSGLLQNIDMVRTKGEDGCALLVFLEWHGIIFHETFYSMKNTCRIIHHPIGIDNGAEVLIRKTFAYIISEAGTYEEHALHRLNLPLALGNIYDCSKLH